MATPPPARAPSSIGSAGLSCVSLFFSVHSKCAKQSYRCATSSYEKPRMIADNSKWNDECNLKRACVFTNYHESNHHDQGMRDPRVWIGLAGQDASEEIRQGRGAIPRFALLTHLVGTGAIHAFICRGPLHVVFAEVPRALQTM